VTGSSPVARLGSAAAARWVEFVSEGLTPAAPHQEVAMKVLNRRCAGLDVHKDEVVA
jgi:hypothetical protein